MSLTAFVTITGALVALMRADPPVSANITRARDRDNPLAEQFDDAVNVQFDGSLPFSGAIMGAPVDWDSRFTIEMFARTTTTTADLAVDPLMDEIYRRLLADTTLGGLVDEIGVPTIEAEYTAEQKKTGWVRMTFPVKHRTTNLTLEQA
jgi:hypothetical protein